MTTNDGRHRCVEEMPWEAIEEPADIAVGQTDLRSIVVPVVEILSLVGGFYAFLAWLNLD